MHSSLVTQLVPDLLLVLAAGLVSGVICKRLGVSMLVGYLVVGALIGHGAFGLISESAHGLEYLAEVGVLLLLFSIGLELSLEELRRMARYFFIGGSVQMILVAVPVFFTVRMRGVPWQGAVLLASAAAFSSTVLVFKALAEWGQTATPHGRRGVGILLFQDVALVPLILLVPLLTGNGETPTAVAFGGLAVKSALFVAAVLLLRAVLARRVVPLLQRLRSVELVVLFALTMLGGGAFGAHLLALPPALGALAAGLALSGNRLSGQIDALVLPYRETFAAIFFVSLGTLMRFDVLWTSWSSAMIVLTAMGLLLILKAAAAGVALRLTKLGWFAAMGMGLGLAQMGEFSFVLLSTGMRYEVIEPLHYDVMMFLALGTLILTPQLLKTGLGLAQRAPELEAETPKPAAWESSLQHAAVVGLGPIGRQVASQLELTGIDVCLIDFSPLNLHPFAQQGFRTVAGDACDSEVLQRAEVARCGLVVVTVASDTTATDIVTSVRELNRTCRILVRCRYQSSVAQVAKAGADTVISEEVEASGALLRLLDGLK